MNIKDFLIDNYIWIIVILLITIITIIGFLADKNNKNKQKKEQDNKTNVVPGTIPMQNINAGQINNQGVMQYQQAQQVIPVQNQMNNNTGIVYNNENNQLQQMNQPQNIPNNQELMNVNTMNVMADNQPITSNTTIPTDVNLMNNIYPVENQSQNVQGELRYQPLSEQTPNVPPQPIPNIFNMTNNNPEMQTPNNSGLNQNSPNIIPTVVAPQPMPQQVVEQPMMEQTLNYNPQPSMPMSMENNNNYGSNMNQTMSNFNQNDTTITNQSSAMPQPIIQNSYNNGQPNYGGMMPQPGTEPTVQSQISQAQTTIPQPINFVFGAQNNNQNM